MHGLCQNILSHCRPHLLKLVCCKNFAKNKKEDISGKSTERTYLLCNQSMTELPEAEFVYTSDFVFACPGNVLLFRAVVFAFSPLPYIEYVLYIPINSTATIIYDKNQIIIVSPVFYTLVRLQLVARLDQQKYIRYRYKKM